MGRLILMRHGFRGVAFDINQTVKFRLTSGTYVILTIPVLGYQQNLQNINSQYIKHISQIYKNKFKNPDIIRADLSLSRTFETGCIFADNIGMKTLSGVKITQSELQGVQPSDPITSLLYYFTRLTSSQLSNIHNYQQKSQIKQLFFTLMQSLFGYEIESVDLDTINNIVTLFTMLLPYELSCDKCKSIQKYLIGWPELKVPISKEYDLINKIESILCQQYYSEDLRHLYSPLYTFVRNVIDGENDIMLVTHQEIICIILNFFGIQSYLAQPLEIFNIEKLINNTCSFSAIKMFPNTTYKYEKFSNICLLDIKYPEVRYPDVIQVHLTI